MGAVGPSRHRNELALEAGEGVTARSSSWKMKRDLL